VKVPERGREGERERKREREGPPERKRGREKEREREREKERNVPNTLREPRAARPSSLRQVCYSVLQDVAGCHRVLHFVTVCCRVLQGVAGCYIL